MERRVGDTMPLPVVETVAAPAVPPPTAAMPVEVPLSPPPVHRDRTPLVLGLLAVAAVVALALSLLALAARDDAPVSPGTPAGSEATTTLPAPTPVLPTSAPAATPAPAVVPPRVAVPTTSASAPATRAPDRGKAKGGKGGD